MLKQFVVSLSSLLICVAPAQSEALRTFQDWTLVCPQTSESLTAKPSCHLSQTVRSEDGKYVFLLASVTKRTNGMVVLILTAPLGIDLGSGLSWQVDEGPKSQLVFNTCTQEGCFAAISLDKKLTTQLRRGSVLQASYKDGGGFPIKANISLRGITLAMEALAQNPRIDHD